MKITPKIYRDKSYLLHEYYKTLNNNSDQLTIYTHRAHNKSTHFHPNKTNNTIYSTFQEKKNQKITTIKKNKRFRHTQLTNLSLLPQAFPPTMEFIQIVQRPAYSQRPYGVLRSPYIEHPGCSVLCNHPTAPHSHRALLNVTRASWVSDSSRIRCCF